jgi:hypoxanthine phosphoribosyltransferase
LCRSSGKQSLVTRKNRKLRKLRRLYPEVNIRLFYQRDFYNLMAKYGLLAANKET